MKIRILSLGEIIWDVYHDKRTLGGAPLNFAAHSAKCGADCYILSAVGKDAYGVEARGIIEASGVKADFLCENTYPTGRCDVTLGNDGIPEYKIARNTAYDNIALSEHELEIMSSMCFDALYFGTLIQRSDRSKEALKHICEKIEFKEIICDVNLRDGCYDAASAAYCLQSATILKISDEEEPQLRKMGLYSSTDPSPESIAMSICDQYPNVRILLFTMGKNGSVTYCAETKKCYYTPAVKAHVVSSVGAGDSFLAAWCSSYLSGEDIETAGEKATTLSAFVVSKKEAVPDYEIKDGSFVF